MSCARQKDRERGLWQVRNLLASLGLLFGEESCREDLPSATGGVQHGGLHLQGVVRHHVVVVDCWFQSPDVSSPSQSALTVASFPASSEPPLGCLIMQYISPPEEDLSPAP